MKRLVIVASGLAAVVLLAALAVAGARRTPPPNRPSALPATHQFTPGACRDAAETVVALARLTRRTDVATLHGSDGAELRRLHDRLVGLRADATGDVRGSMDELIVSLGYLRIRLDSRTAEPSYLRHAESARTRLQEVCVAGPAGQATR